MDERAEQVGRAATPDDVAAVTRCLASAFREDPVWGLWTFPEEATREDLLFSLMRFWVRGGVRHPWLRMTEGAGAVALWVPPGQAEMSAQEELELAEFLQRALPVRAAEVLELLAEFDRHHPHEQPHYYLSLWGTHRDRVGEGQGTALIEECLARIDAERMGSYLESTNPANLARYEALGFRSRKRFGPLGGPQITTMWREPHPG
jgi:ribosomal protein S18 acetylase RimI-like enzyme